MSSAAAPAATAEAAHSFDEIIVPHLPAAYRLARWRLGNEHDAEDAVQEASLRALRYFRTFTGGDARAWFLRIVHNTCSGRRGRMYAATDPFDEDDHSSLERWSDPERLLLHTRDVTLIERAMSNLPDRVRQLLVLRELEGLSYRQMADLIGIPIGTVMSGLSRGRRALRAAVDHELNLSGRTEHASTTGRERNTGMTRVERTAMELDLVNEEAS